MSRALVCSTPEDGERAMRHTWRQRDWFPVDAETGCRYIA
jgi:hypothetical protein